MHLSEQRITRAIHQDIAQHFIALETNSQTEQHLKYIIVYSLKLAMRVQVYKNM